VYKRQLFILENDFERDDVILTDLADTKDRVVFTVKGRETVVSDCA